MMNYSEAMELCDRYIHSNSEENITASVLAELCGYSLYHFCHIFRAWHGVSVGKYIRHYRLYQSCEHLLRGESITFAAMEAGFDTNAGFTKAFRRLYGMSPSEYKSSCLKGVKAMEPIIKSTSSLTAFGYNIKPETEKIDILESAAYWHSIDFSELPKYPENCSDKGEIALWYHPEDVSGELTYFFGYATDDKVLPDGFTSVTIPAGKYAVFGLSMSDDIKQSAVDIKKTWKYAFNEWLDKSQYRFNSNGMCFEYYKGKTVEIYIPIADK